MTSADRTVHRPGGRTPQGHRCGPILSRDQRCRTWRTPPSSARRVPSGRITAIDTAAASAADGVLAVLTHRRPARRSLAAAIACRPCSASPHRARRSSRCRTSGALRRTTRSRSSSLTAHERAQYAASIDRGSRYDERASVTTIEQGREQAYEPKAIFGGFMPGRSGRGDVEGRSPRPTYGWTGAYHSRPTTTTRSSHRRPPRSGTATG